ncbi:MAG TPA: CAAX prenyl protease-related protein [Telluria sp.]|nr:CAAX prenyl protease-related protein [Telluria sp.]
MREPDEQLSAELEDDTDATFSRASWVRIAPFLAYIGFIVGTDLLQRLAGFPLSELRWLYAVRIGVVAALLAWYWREYRELRRWDADLPAVFVALLMGGIVFFLWISLNAPWMLVGSPTGFDPRTGGQLDWTLVTLRLLGATAVVPLMEELFWRSFLMRWIVAPEFGTVDPAQTTLKSVVISSVLFGVEHNLWLAGIVAGVAYSWVYVRYRTLWLSILAHALTNFLLGIWVIQTASWNYW